jgi:hypothetical protein
MPPPADRLAYHLLLEALPSDVPGPARLKRGLKYLLRVCQLKARLVEEMQPARRL